MRGRNGPNLQLRSTIKPGPSTFSRNTSLSRSKIADPNPQEGTISIIANSVIAQRYKKLTGRSPKGSLERPSFAASINKSKTVSPSGRSAARPPKGGGLRKYSKWNPKKDLSIADFELIEKNEIFQNILVEFDRELDERLSARNPSKGTPASSRKPVKFGKAAVEVTLVGANSSLCSDRDDGLIGLENASSLKPQPNYDSEHKKHKKVNFSQFENVSAENSKNRLSSAKKEYLVRKSISKESVSAANQGRVRPATSPKNSKMVKVLGVEQKLAKKGKTANYEQLVKQQHGEMLDLLMQRKAPVVQDVKGNFIDQQMLQKKSERLNKLMAQPETRSKDGSATYNSKKALIGSEVAKDIDSPRSPLRELMLSADQDPADKNNKDGGSRDSSHTSSRVGENKGEESERNPYRPKNVFANSALELQSGDLGLLSRDRTRIGHSSLEDLNRDRQGGTPNQPKPLKLDIPQNPSWSPPRIHLTGKFSYSQLPDSEQKMMRQVRKQTHIML